MESTLFALVLGIGIPFLIIVFFLEGMLIGKIIPTDLILPIALIGLGNSYIDYISIILITSLSSTLGQTFLYKALSNKGLDQVKKNKYITIKDQHLDTADEYFEKYGSQSVAISNCIPGIRGLLTIPAAIHSIPMKRFVSLSFTGNLFFHIVVGSVALGIFSTLL